MDNQLKEGCDIGMAYYRCDFPGYRQILSKTSPEIKNLKTKMDALDKTIESFTYKALLIYQPPSIDKLTSQINDLTKFIFDKIVVLDSAMLNDEEYFIIDMTEARLDSIYGQLDYFHPTYSSKGTIEFAGEEWGQAMDLQRSLEKLLYIPRRALMDFMLK